MKELIAQLLASVEWPQGYTQEMKMDVLAQSTDRLTEHLTNKMKGLPGYSSEDDLDALRTSLRKHPENFTSEEKIGRHFQEMAVLEKYASAKGFELNIEQGAATAVLQAQLKGRKSLKSDDDIRTDIAKVLNTGKSVELKNAGVGKAELLNGEIAYRSTMAQYLKANGRPEGTAREDAGIFGRVKDAWNGMSTPTEQVKKAALSVNRFVEQNPSLPPQRVAELTDFAQKLQSDIDQFPEETLTSLTVPDSKGETSATKVIAPLKQEVPLMSEKEKVAAKEAAKPAPKTLPQTDEQKFQTWYAGWAAKAGLDPDPDSPLHKYDYRKAYKAGAKPEIDPSDGLYHWPSEFKDDDHPNRFVNGVDTKKSGVSSEKQEMTPMEPKTVKAVVGGKEVELIEAEDGNLIDQDELKRREDEIAKVKADNEAAAAAETAKQEQEQLAALPPKEKAAKMSEMIQKALEAQESGNVQDAIMNGAGVFSNLATLFTGLNAMNEELPEYRPGRYLNEMLSYARKLADTGMDPVVREQREGDVRRGLDKDLEVVKRNVGGDAAGVLGNRFASIRDYYNELAKISAEDMQIKMAAVPLHMSALEKAEAQRLENFNKRYEQSVARTNAGGALVSQSFQNLHNREQMQRHYGKGSVNQVLAWAELQRAQDAYTDIETDSGIAAAENAVGVGASDEQIKVARRPENYNTQNQFLQERTSNPTGKK
jgi:hypothetical protein